MQQLPAAPVAAEVRAAVADTAVVARRGGALHGPGGAAAERAGAR